MASDWAADRLADPICWTFDRNHRFDCVGKRSHSYQNTCYWIFLKRVLYYLHYLIPGSGSHFVLLRCCDCYIHSDWNFVQPCSLRDIHALHHALRHACSPWHIHVGIHDGTPWVPSKPFCRDGIPNRSNRNLCHMRSPIQNTDYSVPHIPM